MWDTILIDGQLALFTTECDEFDEHSRLWCAFSNNLLDGSGKRCERRLVCTMALPTSRGWVGLGAGYNRAFELNSMEV
jgi:hypothetical protein